MKRTVLPFLIGVIFFLGACNNDSKTTQSEPASNKKDTMAMSAAEDTSSVKQISPTMASVDAPTAASFKEVVNDYLHIKNALAANNAVEAASSGKALAATLSKINSSALTPEQKKLYTDNADDLKENAEHISKNADKIAHQREHFAMMSEDVYDLVKGFGGGQPLYLDHCPMAQNNKGANWLSETKEIHNPYLGTKMPDCGSVEAVIKP